MPPSNSALAMFMQQTGRAPAEQMQQWGQSESQSISTTGNRPWSPEGAEKAKAVLEGMGSFLPGIGQAIAAKDYSEAMEENDSTGGVLAALSFIPGAGAITKLGKSFMQPSAYGLKMMRRGNAAEKAMAKTIKHSDKINVGANSVQTGWDIAN
jgi:hypothetical protein